MCKLNIPDCFNCPYEDCTATSKEILRQWHYSNMQRAADNPDRIQKTVGAHAIPIAIAAKIHTRREVSE